MKLNDLIETFGPYTNIIIADRDNNLTIFDSYLGNLGYFDMSMISEQVLGPTDREPTIFKIGRFEEPEGDDTIAAMNLYSNEYQFATVNMIKVLFDKLVEPFVVIYVTKE